MALRRKKTEEFSIGNALASVGDTLKQTAYLPNLTRYEPWFKQEWFHKSQKKGRLFIGGNRTGKTVSNVVECIWWLTKTHPYIKMPVEPVRGRFVTVDFKNIIKPVTIPMFKQWLPTHYLINGNWDDSYDKETDTLHLENGSFIEFMSYEQETDKFASASRHFVAFDEEPPKVIWAECLARLIDTNGSWWLSMTPLFGMTWVYKQVYMPSKSNPNSPFFVVQADMAENPHLPDEAREAYLATLSEEDVKARKEGNFVPRGGNVFKNFNPDRHRLAREDFKLTSDMRIFTSVDQGWVHPTAWLWHAVNPAGEVVTFHEMRMPSVTVSEWARIVHDFEKALKYVDTGGTARVYQRTGDPALLKTNAQTGLSDQMEYARHGIFLALENVPKGPGSVDVGLKKLDDYFKVNPETGRPTWRYTENCILLEEEMLNYRWDVWASKKLEEQNAPKTTPHKLEDDLCDCLRYFIASQPDLSFDNSVRTPQATDRLGAVQDIPVPFRDYQPPEEKEYREFSSLEGDSGYFLQDTYSSWEMEY